MLNRIIQEDLEFIIKQKIIPWENLKGKTILISGANGFLPAYLVETLLFLNETLDFKIKVIALVRNKAKAEARFAHYLQRPDLIFMIQDVCEPINFKDDLDVIIHAASQASPKYYGIDPVGTLLPNCIGTYHLLELAKQKKVEDFLFFSSGEVYGKVNERQIPTKEIDYGYLDPMNIRSCYGESKRIGETMCVSWAHQFAVPVKVIRPGHTYGPGMSLDDGRVFADFVANVVRNQNIILCSDGTATRSFCYLTDFVLGCFLVLMKGKNTESYNIGSDLEISIFDLAKKLVALFPEKKLKVIINDGDFKTGYINSPAVRGALDVTKLKNLGWHAYTSIEDGFKRTILSFIE